MGPGENAGIRAPSPHSPPRVAEHPGGRACALTTGPPSCHLRGVAYCSLSCPESQCRVHSAGRSWEGSSAWNPPAWWSQRLDWDRSLRPRTAGTLFTSAAPALMASWHWNYVAMVLLTPLGLLGGADLKDWVVALPKDPMDVQEGSCVTLECSYNIPLGKDIGAVCWKQNRVIIAYHSDKAYVDAAFKNRTWSFSKHPGNCSLQLMGLRLGDQGTYQVCTGKGNEEWCSPGAVQLRVTAHPCRPSLKTPRGQGSLSCSVQPDCQGSPVWDKRDDQRIPAGMGNSSLQVSPSQLGPNMMLSCRVDGHRDQCSPEQNQPLQLGNLHLKIFLPGAKQVVKEHDYVTMRCLDATRIPVARYFWTHGDKWLQERGQNLHISDTSTAHGGVYTCSIWVSGPGWAFLVSSGNKSITVHYAPKGVNITPPSPSKLSEGEYLILTCHFNSSLPEAVTYNWYKDSMEWKGSQKILKVGAKDAGIYHCVVQNEVGPTESSRITIRASSQGLVSALAAGISGAVFLLLLLGLGLALACRKKWGRKQSKATMAGRYSPAQVDAPMSELTYKNIEQYEPVDAGPQDAPELGKEQLDMDTPPNLPQRRWGEPQGTARQPPSTASP
ncbi:B-cell receptor CD22 isoform X2 [Alligator mississippiensis]|uniref:B-cell receptor CD22 isoform X2 n=1 Tax=Alligator mississippiensis TaxID=8496 RepID=UPI00287775F7|nr:B-cell receptor CD22 isoform X2 [Alligator mississippiensis]